MAPGCQHRRTLGSTAAGLPLQALLKRPLQKMPRTTLGQQQQILQSRWCQPRLPRHHRRRPLSLQLRQRHYLLLLPTVLQRRNPR